MICSDISKLLYIISDNFEISRGVFITSEVILWNDNFETSRGVFITSEVILWNDLPIDVNKFKSKLKTFLFKRVYELS